MMMMTSNLRRCDTVFQKDHKPATIGNSTFIHWHLYEDYLYMHNTTLISHYPPSSRGASKTTMEHPTAAAFAPMPPPPPPPPPPATMPPPPPPPPPSVGGNSRYHHHHRRPKMTLPMPRRVEEEEEEEEEGEVVEEGEKEGEEEESVVAYLNNEAPTRDDKKKRKCVGEVFPCKRLKNSTPYIEITGDLIKLYHTDPTAIIVQINNCVARRAHYRSFTWELAQVLPYADPYAERKEGAYPNLADAKYRPELGSIQLRRPPASVNSPSPTIACCFAQYRMGNCESIYYNKAPRVDDEYLIHSLEKDNYVQRLTYFARSLHGLYTLLKNERSKCYKKVIMPKYIGCGLAGGKWEHYENLISKFTSKLKMARPDVTVYVVKKIYQREQQ